MSSLLDGCAESFRQSRDRFVTELMGLDAETALRRPTPGSWSVAECVDHLRLSLDLYGAQLEPRLEGAPSGETTADYGRGTLVGRMLLWVLEPSRDRVFKVKVPGRFRPLETQGLQWEPLRESYPAQCERWLGIVEQARGVALGEIILPTPVSSWLKVSAAQALEINAWHQERHLDQAVRALGGPR